MSWNQSDEGQALATTAIAGTSGCGERRRAGMAPSSGRSGKLVVASSTRVLLGSRLSGRTSNIEFAYQIQIQSPHSRPRLGHLRRRRAYHLQRATTVTPLNCCPPRASRIATVVECCTELSRTEIPTARLRVAVPQASVNWVQRLGTLRLATYPNFHDKTALK